MKRFFHLFIVIGFIAITIYAPTMKSYTKKADNTQLPEQGLKNENRTEKEVFGCAFFPFGDSEEILSNNPFLVVDAENGDIYASECSFFENHDRKMYEIIVDICAQKEYMLRVDAINAQDLRTEIYAKIGINVNK